MPCGRMLNHPFTLVVELDGERDECLGQQRGQGGRPGVRVSAGHAPNATEAARVAS